VFGSREGRDITRCIAASAIVLGAASQWPRASHAQGSSGATADIVLVNGRVFTADPSQPWAQGLAVRADRVIGVGSTSEILALADAHTKRIDVGGRVVIPGFNDAHDLSARRCRGSRSPRAMIPFRIRRFAMCSIP
jgi:hypothetical protein